MSCGDDAEPRVNAERPDVPVVDGSVSHPTPGAIAQKIDGISYDVDEGRSFDLATTKARIEAADAVVAANIPASTGLVAPLYLNPLWEPFHSWPNVINLTEVFYADSDLYDQIMARILAVEPDATTVASTTDTAVAAGERIFLIRDYVNTAITTERVYHEVHYAMFVNLDVQEVTELRTHAQVADGLGDTVEPLAAALQTVFDDDEPQWEMCLRGNIRRHKYQAVVVDRIDNADGEQYWIRRMHRHCRGSDPDFPPPPDDDPDPEDRPDPPLRGGDGSGDPPENNPTVPRPPELERDREGVVEDPPVVPWPWKLPPAENDEPGESGRASGDADAHNPDCNQELAKVTQLRDGFEQEYDQIHGSLGADADAINELLGGWRGDLTFGHPDIAMAYQQAKMQVDMLLAQKAMVQSDVDAQLDRRRQALENSPLAVQLLFQASTIWDNMLHVGGEWSNIVIAWSPSPLIPANAVDNFVVIVIGDAEVAAYQRSVAIALMNGKTLDEAHAEALKNPLIYPHGIPYGHLNTQLVWAAYRDCLRELYKEMLQKYLEERLQGLSEEDAEAAIAGIIDGKAALSSADQAAADNAVMVAAQVAAELERLRQACEDLEAEIDKIRRQFRADAADILGDAQGDKALARQKQWILEAFGPYCGDPDAADGVPPIIDQQTFCAALDELITIAQDQNCPRLAAYLMMLKAANCP